MIIKDYKKFLKKFSKDFAKVFPLGFRAIFLENILNDRYVDLDPLTRSELFGKNIDLCPELSVQRNNSMVDLTQYNNMNIPSFMNLPSIEEQRHSLRDLNLESPRKFKIIYLGRFANGDTDIVACLLKITKKLRS